MDLNFNFKEIFSAFMVLFAVIDITGSTPVIIGLKDKGLKVEAGKAALLSSVIFLLFLFLGDAILSLFGVDIQSFAVAGSIIILILACEMVLDIEIFKYQGPGGSATVVPIIFPLIAGAGALTTVLSLRAEYHVENIIVAILLNQIPQHSRTNPRQGRGLHPPQVLRHHPARHRRQALHRQHRLPFLMPVRYSVNHSQI